MAERSWREGDGLSDSYKLESVRLQLTALHMRTEGCMPDGWVDLLQWVDDQCERAERADGESRGIL